MTDNFNGDTPHLIRCINALLELDAAGALKPHGLPGHARTLLSAAAVRLSASTKEAESAEPRKLWLWRNFVGGRPEYWAFDNPYPCVSVGGDPLTLGEPCGYAIVKWSVNGRPNRSEEEALRRISPPTPTYPKNDPCG